MIHATTLFRGKGTTILIVRDQDIRKLAGQSKSYKDQEAQQLMVEGQAIRILTEPNFKRLIGLIP